MNGYCNYPLTRKDEMDMRALVNALVYGGDVTNIGDDRRSRLVVSDEALTGDIYNTGYTQELW